MHVSKKMIKSPILCDRHENPAAPVDSLDSTNRTSLLQLSSTCHPVCLPDHKVLIYITTLSIPNPPNCLLHLLCPCPAKYCCT